jgi:hypothetical protein
LSVAGWEEGAGLNPRSIWRGDGTTEVVP